MHKSKIFALSLLGFFLAGPAMADNTRQIECIAVAALASTNNNSAFGLAPKGGATMLRATCYTDANATTPAVISFEDGAANDVTHATLTCGENGTTPTWIPATAANTFLEGEPIVFDVDNSSDTQQYTICVELKTKQ